MAKLTFSGPLFQRVSSLLTLSRISITVGIKQISGRMMAPDWDIQTEIGIRFWRHQFTKAMGQSDMAKGRNIFNSLLTLTDDEYDVEIKPDKNSSGKWFHPIKCTSDTVLLYFHGGGYTFNGPVSERFAAMLAHHTETKLFMPNYRLTPEHAHPAQCNDALAAWNMITRDTSPDQVIIIGDSAGGHMALTLLQSLKLEGLQQPALCIALCPWTDIGARGDSLTQNNQYDLVQGWMALKFGEWLDPDDAYGREELSPFTKNYAGLAPMYMQVGGREILRDMIIDFAKVQAENGADVILDIWDDMPHNFQAYDSMKVSSSEALKRIRTAVSALSETNTSFFANPDMTHIATGKFQDENESN